MILSNMPKLKQDEYLRRNLLHCKSVGIVAEAEAVLSRLMDMKKPPKWIIKSMNEIIKRGAPISQELAYHRGEVFHETA